MNKRTLQNMLVDKILLETEIDELDADVKKAQTLAECHISLPSLVKKQNQLDCLMFDIYTAEQEVKELEAIYL